MASLTVDVRATQCHSRGRQVLFILTLLATSSMLSACALINPHVSWREIDRPKCSGDASCGAVTLSDAIAYADNAKAAYKIALGDQARLPNLLALGLIPLGAAALGLGITGGSSAAITALGLTGAAGYAGGTWLSSKPQQRAYVAGYNAVVCTVEAV